jgi:hypothetical protein
MRLPTDFDEWSAFAKAADADGEAIALASWEQGRRTLTEDEAAALDMSMLYGSDSWPIVKLGRGWVYDFRSIQSACIYPTKYAATSAWLVLLAKWRKIHGLQAQERAIAEQKALDALRAALPVLEEAEQREWESGGPEILPEAEAVRASLSVSANRGEMLDGVNMSLYIESMGKQFRVRLVTPSIDAANDYCHEHPGCGVIASDAHSGLAFVAEIAARKAARR